MNGSCCGGFAGEWHAPKWEGECPELWVWVDGELKPRSWYDYWKENWKKAMKTETEEKMRTNE
ncbi:hypothetical protein LCGC14_0236510 [marine sediment metagenome]|uniref:Uncharacterized protein n=1 Tax=marine sediment metagenome TaxID=412755 RepID=A0A0F9XDH9_9ZZZZ